MWGEGKVGDILLKPRRELRSALQVGGPPELAMSDSTQPTRPNRLTSSIIGNTGTLVLVAVIALLNNIVIAQRGGPDARGYYAVAVAALALAGPLLGRGILRVSSVKIAGGENESSVLTFAAKTAAFNIAVSAAVVAWAWFSPKSVGQREVAIGLVLLAMPLIVLLHYAQGAALGRRRTVLYNASILAPPSVMLVLHVVTLAPENPVQPAVNLVASMSMCAVVFFVIALVHARSTWEASRSWGEGRPLFRSFSRMTALSMLFENAGNRLDLLVLAFILSPLELGLFALGEQLANTLVIVSQGTGHALIVEASSASTNAERSRIMGKSYRIGSTAVMVVFLLTLPLAQPAIGVLFGEAFLPSYQVYVVLAAFLPLRIYLLSFNGLTQTLGSPQAGVKVTAISAAIGIAAIFVFVPTWGVQGAVAARVLGLLGGALLARVAAPVVTNGRLPIFPFARRADWKSILCRTP